MALAIAKRLSVPIHAIRAHASEHIEKTHRAYRFAVIELDVVNATDPEREQAAEYVAEVAREQCIVATALDVPIRLTVDVDAAVQEPTTA